MDDFAGSRSPLQLGAELYGHAGVESDAEVLCLMMATLRAAEVYDLHLDIGHVGIYRGLARQAGLDAEQERAVFTALQRKAEPEVAALVREYAVPDADAQRLIALANLNGGDEVIALARERLAGAEADVLAAVDYIENLGGELKRRLPGVPLHYDLAELRGYGYHSGVVFAAFVPGEGQAVAGGGRYDHIGEVFGRARPATGFSADLKTLLRVGHFAASPPPGRIMVPLSGEAGLEQRVADLRGQGWVILRELPGQIGGATELECTHRLEFADGHWDVRLLD
jgi:ATP phosphoribosyltransferase regulatory subunit